jgi:hypothetical protein
MRTAIHRRSFVKKGLTAATIATSGLGLLANTSTAAADHPHDQQGERLTRDDAALLRFAAAAEMLETDFYVSDLAVDDVGKRPPETTPQRSKRTFEISGCVPFQL